MFFFYINNNYVGFRLKKMVNMYMTKQMVWHNMKMPSNCAYSRQRQYNCVTRSLNRAEKIIINTKQTIAYNLIYTKW